MKTRLEDHYLTAVRPALMEKFGYSNNLAVPKIEKVVVNMGVGEAVRDSKKSNTQHVTLPLSPVRSLSSPVQRMPMQPSSCAKAWPLDARLHCVVRRCMNSLTVL